MKLQRQAMGDLCMIPSDKGMYLYVTDVSETLYSILDDDDRDTMIGKIEQVLEQLK